MAMVGFSFTKISAERKPVNEMTANIESNAAVTNVSELPSIDAKKTLLKFEFEFIVKYEPSIGKIELKGELVEIYDKDFASRILAEWAKDKKISQDVMQDVFNNLLARSNIEAIVVARDIGLPSPLQMPRVDVKADEKSKSEPKEKGKK